MTFHRLGWPRSSQYWRTSFTAESSASEPPLQKNAQSSPAGVISVSCCASRSWGSFRNRIECVNEIFRAWSAAAWTRSSRP